MELYHTYNVTYRTLDQRTASPCVPYQSVPRTVTVYAHANNSSIPSSSLRSLTMNRLSLPVEKGWDAQLNVLASSIRRPWLMEPPGAYIHENSLDLSL